MTSWMDDWEIGNRTSGFNDVAGAIGHMPQNGSTSNQTIQNAIGAAGQLPPNMSGIMNNAAAMTLQGTMAAIAAQERMLAASLAQQAEFYYQTREDMMPWLESGEWALGELKGFMKEGAPYFRPPSYSQRTPEDIGPRPVKPEGGKGSPERAQWKKDVAEWDKKEAAQGPPSGTYDANEKYGISSTYEESPYYNFLQEEGARALDRSAASRGMLLSGPQVKASERFGQNLASTDMDNWLRRYYDMANLESTQYYNKLGPYQTMAGVGQQTGAQLGNLGASYAGMGTSAMMKTGTNTANMLQQGYSTAAGLTASGQASDAMNQWQYRQNQLTAQREQQMWNQWNSQRQGDDGGTNWMGGVSGGLTGALGGAAIGAKVGFIGGPWGAAIGGVGGFLAGLFS